MWINMDVLRINKIISVGEPIEVEKIEEPTQQEINYVHKKFIDSITHLFETQKHKYLTNSEEVTLEIV